MGGRDVSAVIDGYCQPARSALLVLRQLILDTAESTEGVGELEEALRWGQPSFLTSASKTGSTIRIDAVKPTDPGDYAMYFICHTKLVQRFRRLFGDVFRYTGDRGLVFTTGQEIPEDELRACIVMALTYRLDNGQS